MRAEVQKTDSTIHLAPGESIRITAGGASAGTVWRLPDVSGAPGTGAHGSIAGTAVGPESETFIGPFSLPRRYLIEATRGALDYEVIVRELDASQIPTAAAGPFAGVSIEAALTELHAAVLEE